ncbi:hypothetical protein [Serratia sp. DD3]|uniref:hypothetical protein n=1 Tax=Serratia sp. DD3 TaxID=1410619 RepID=UPI0004D712F3|nr:hypothetical protein [Serratia sp. DD3]KEY57096.1 hypothetical protein SRDD_39980 [Serratia sp. DD3]KEY57102.1 hypothetical protein SRDD_40040 [Serratia sp. DD3]
MGSFFNIGRKPCSNNYSDRSLTVGLDRSSSNALEALFDDAFQEHYPELHEKIMLYLPLDQIVLAELEKEEFNVAIKAVRECINNRTELTRGQTSQKLAWEEYMEPIIQQDERYQQS